MRCSDPAPFDAIGFEIVDEGDDEEEDEDAEVVEAPPAASIDVTVRHRTHDPVRAYLREIGEACRCSRPRRRSRSPSASSAATQARQAG